MPGTPNDGRAVSRYESTFYSRFIDGARKGVASVCCMVSEPNIVWFFAGFKVVLRGNAELLVVYVCEGVTEFVLACTSSVTGFTVSLHVSMHA